MRTTGGTLSDDTHFQPHFSITHVLFKFNYCIFISPDVNQLFLQTVWNLLHFYMFNTYVHLAKILHLEEL